MALLLGLALPLATALDNGTHTPDTRYPLRLVDSTCTAHPADLHHTCTCVHLDYHVLWWNWKPDPCPIPLSPPNPPSTRRVLYPFAAPDLAEGRRVHMLAGCGQLIVGSQPPPNHPTTQPPTTQPPNNPTTQPPKPNHPTTQQTTRARTDATSGIQRLRSRWVLR